MSSSSKNNAYIFEQQNDVRLDELGSKISAIKNITIDIHQDVTDQDRLLDESPGSPILTDCFPRNWHYMNVLAQFVVTHKIFNKHPLAMKKDGGDVEDEEEDKRWCFSVIADNLMDVLYKFYFNL
ncbi:hypothetical protein G6F56_001055 [Rhizopus delemar]|nr:hypothetical protein G6F56_001055 [Rhizopus delemar]